MMKRILQISAAIVVLSCMPSDSSNATEPPPTSSTTIAPPTIEALTESSQNISKFKYETVHTQTPSAVRQNDTEVPDLLNINKSTLAAPGPLIIQIHSLQSSESELPKSDAEMIEDGEDTEEELRWHYGDDNQDSVPMAISSKQTAAAVTSTNGSQVAGIFIAALVCVSVVGYVALVSWRKFLKRRYGNRHVLTEEDYYNDEIKYFSL